MIKDINMLSVTYLGGRINVTESNNWDVGVASLSHGLYKKQFKLEISSKNKLFDFFRCKTQLKCKTIYPNYYFQKL